MRPLVSRNASFRWIWWGQLVSQMGTKIYLIALAWHFVHDLDRNEGLVYVLLAGSLPVLFLGPLAGPLIDRWDRRRLLIGADIASGLFALLIAAAIALSLHPGFIYFGVFLLGLSQLFFNPAARALVPSIVEPSEVQEATSDLSLVTNLAILAGAAAGGVLVALLGVTNAVLANAASFLLSALASSRIRPAPAPAGPGGSFLGDLVDGITSLRGTAVLKLMLLASALNIFYIPVTVYLPVLVDDVLKLSSAHFGAAEACAPLGSILAGIYCAMRPTERHLAFVKVGLVFLGLSFASVALFRSFPGTLVSMFFLGVSLTVVNVHAVSWFTKSVAPAMLGRFFNLMDVIASGTFPLAYLMAGLLVARVNMYVLFLAHGLILAGLGAVGGLALRDRRAPQPTPVEA